MRGNKISNFSASSANPRKFSRGSDGLNPEQILYIYLQLQVVGTRDDITNTFSLIERYKEEWPQTEADIVAISGDKGIINIIVGVNIGEAQEALNGISEKVASSFGFLNTLVTNMYQYRPIFVPPPTDRERDNFYQLMAVR